MAAELLTDLSRATDANSNPLSGATWYFYASGGSTPQAVYANASLGTSLGSSVEADGGGLFPPIYFNAALLYRGVLKTAGGSTLQDIDPVNPAVMYQLGLSSGSSLIGARRSSFVSGAPTQAVQNLLDDRSVNVFENFTPAQIAAVRNGTPIAGLVDAIEEVTDWAGERGRAVILPDGLYDCRRQLNLHHFCWLKAESCASWPVGAYHPGFQRQSGVVLFKNHNDSATIYVDGGSTYASCGGIEGVSISGDASQSGSNQGDGIVIDRVGGYYIKRIRMFGVPRDGLVFGVTSGDVTGQVHLNEAYINNPGRYCFYNRSKWLKASQIESDGGAVSFYNDGAPNIDVTQFHFEGASSKALVLAGANGSSRFRGGFINMTNPASTKAIEIASAAGNTDISLNDLDIRGHGALEVGIDILAAAWRTTIKGGEIHDIPLGVRDAAKGTNIQAKFIGCALAIESIGDQSDYSGSWIEATGAWGIRHISGGGGVWSDIRTDKPFKEIATAITFTGALSSATSGTLTSGWAGATGTYVITFSTGAVRRGTLTNSSTAVSWTGALSATANADAAPVLGVFGTNRVKDNPGFVTSASGQTSLISSGGTFAHGMAVVPYNIELHGTSPYAVPADIVVTMDAVNVTLTWPGGGSVQLFWHAIAKCETA